MVSCNYEHCLHINKNININKAVCNGGFFYHSDCFADKQIIDKIITAFQKINPTVQIDRLKDVINKIIYERHINGELLLYGVKYYINKELPLQSPNALYSVVKNPQMLLDYEKEKAWSDNHHVIIHNDVGTSFTYRPRKVSSFADMFKR